MEAGGSAEVGDCGSCLLTSYRDREKGMLALHCTPPLSLFSLVLKLISAKGFLGNPKLYLINTLDFFFLNMVEMTMEITSYVFETKFIFLMGYHHYPVN